MNDFPKEFNEKSNAKTKTHFGINFHPETDDDLLMIISLISDNIFHKEKYLLNLNINRFVESDLKEKFQEFSSFDEMKNIDREIVPQMTADDEDFERKVNFFFINKHFLLDKPKGQESPSAQAVTVKKYIRDPKVAAYVLKVAEGICGYCEKTAPFNRVDGSPYLETHHIKPLAEGGADTVENCVALCPNCHRAIHSSGDRNKRLVKLMER
ncbi:hypothetical protein A0U91_07080 [Acetobacter persici]|uniref:HNH nuclease domain-containing protein n=2 Tax=Acetobacter persici TaxID=1076596 RepID=A0A1U9LEC1_9PROT|nr:hypothetical protein A0U91_07080 [Acetobacter persici]